MERGEKEEEDEGREEGGGLERREAGGVRGRRTAGPASVERAWRRVALSARDWEVLRWANEQKFLMFDQVAQWFPEGEPTPTASRRKPDGWDSPAPCAPGNWYVLERLRKLVRFDVLRRVPILHRGRRRATAGAHGFDLLEGPGQARGLSRLEEIDWKNFVHDRAATDLRWLFEKQFGAGWLAERVLRRELGLRTPPDAIAHIGGQTIAIEVELNRKNLERYLSIVQRYLSWADPDWTSPLRPARKAELEHMFGKVLPAALAKTDLWNLRPPDLSRFRFTTLAAIRDRKTWWTVSTPSEPRAGTL